MYRGSGPKDTAGLDEQRLERWARLEDIKNQEYLQTVLFILPVFTQIPTPSSQVVNPIAARAPHNGSVTPSESMSTIESVQM